jgi:DME family drug/metabolite transporter
MAAMFVGGAVLSAPLLTVGSAQWMTTENGIALSLYLGIVTIGIVYSCLGWGLRKMPAPTVVTLTLAEPMAAAVLSTVVLHQSIGIAGWLGVAIVLAALVTTTRATGRVSKRTTDVRTLRPHALVRMIDAPCRDRRDQPERRRLRHRR